MSREVPFRTLFRIFLPFCVTTFVFSTKCVDSSPDRCLEVVGLDINEIEDYLPAMNVTDVPTVKMMAAGFKCPISALPFGALKSDWSRLLLLQEAQPEGSIIKRKLVRLMRILIVAYYQMEESFDVIKSDAHIPHQLPGRETMTTTTSESRSSSVNQSWPTKASSAVAAAAVAENAAAKALGNCLKQSLKDILSRSRPNRTKYGNVVFERLKGRKHGEHAPRRRNEINGRAKNADVPAKISPPVANDFWRYAQFPTGSPLTISAIAPPYRVQGLNGFRTNPRKLRKRAGLNSDGHTRTTVGFTAPDKNKEKSSSREELCG